jgi:hypothetical protein
MIYTFSLNNYQFDTLIIYGDKVIFLEIQKLNKKINFGSRLKLFDLIWRKVKLWMNKFNCSERQINLKIDWEKD